MILYLQMEGGQGAGAWENRGPERKWQEVGGSDSNKNWDLTIMST